MAKSSPKLIKDDEESVCTMNARKRIRDVLESDIELFLRNGGSIQEVDMNVTADPPTKPVSKYGGRPI